MSDYFDYVHLENDIHHFTWLSQTKHATSEYYDFIQQVYDELPEDTEVVRILHDYRYALFIPLINVLPNVRSLKLMYPHLKRRIAYLSNDGHIEALMKSIATMANQTGSRQYFKPDDAHLAISWLLE